MTFEEELDALLNGAESLPVQTKAPCRMNQNDIDTMVGDLNACAILTAAQVREIRKRARTRANPKGETSTTLAREFGISRRHANAIAGGKRYWQHVV